MKLVCKIVRKLGLGQPVFNILSLFVRHGGAEMSTGEALTLLGQVSPDTGSSCIRSVPLESKPAESIDLDIIIPCYNAEDYVRKCIDSVIAQDTKYRWRIIAIDDGSTDSTGSILDSYSSDSRILIKHQSNRGFSGARNSGLSLSGARYVFFLDSDDMLPAGTIDALLSRALESGAVITEGAFTAVNINGKTLTEYPHRDGIIPNSECEFGFLCGKLFRRDVFSDIMLPEGYWYEDSIMAHIIDPRLRLRNEVLCGCSESVFLYRMNPVGITHSGSRRSKCIDALWIHLHLFKDRRALGIPLDQQYYEYLLRMLVQTYHRTENQPVNVKQAIFTVWADFFASEFGGFSTGDAFYSRLEKAVCTGDFKKYRLFCTIN